MRYLSGRRFNIRDYEYGAWLYDPFVKLWKLATYNTAIGTIIK